MITLNLLPPELQKSRKPRMAFGLPAIPRLPMMKISLYVAGGLLGIHSFLLVALLVWSLSLKGLQMRWEAVTEKRKAVAELNQRYADLAAKEKLLQQVTIHRPLWSQKLKGLSDSMLPGIWLRELSLGERSVPSQGGQAQQEKVLILEGTAASVRGEEPAVIGRFIRSLKENPYFFSEFQEAELESMRRRSIQEIEVIDFKVICTFRGGAAS